MIRNLRASGMAMVAVLAMSALVATAAQAQFTASSYPKSATAESAHGNDTFTFEAGVVTCKAHFAIGPLTAASTTVTVTPTYTECTTGFIGSVSMNGCDYLFHDTAVNHQNRITITCPAGKSIVFVAGPCEWTVPAQGPLSSVITTTSGSHINARANIGGITYTVSKDGFLCPFNGTGHKTGATYVQHNPVTWIPSSGSISVD